MPVEPASTVVVALKALGSAMVDDQVAAEDAGQPAINSTIPPIYTYWGQFIDHDLTANTDRDTDVSITKNPFKPEPPAKVLRNLRNLREPAHNLDSLYGDGPDSSRTGAVPYVDSMRFELGMITEGAPGAQVPPIDDLERDLPRDPRTSKALIGDGRNDENLIVAQLHVAFLRFHNEVVNQLQQEHGDWSAQQIFTRARDLVRWHYQWLVVHDFLETIAQPGVTAQVLASQNPIFRPIDSEVFMPLEFSVAAFRFGHSMVRAAYDHNRNFGQADGNPNNRIPYQ